MRTLGKFTLAAAVAGALLVTAPVANAATSSSPDPGLTDLVADVTINPILLTAYFDVTIPLVD